MVRKTVALVALAMSFSVGAANCNLENIKGNWIWYLPGTDGSQQVNQQCSVNISVSQGNSAAATVNGMCTDLSTGDIGTLLPGSVVSFVPKSCNLVGTILTQEVPPPGFTWPVITVTTNINAIVATNKQSLSGAWSTAAPMYPVLTSLVAAGTISGSVGSIAEPINTVQNGGSSVAPTPYTPAPSCPGHSCSAPGQNK